MATIASMPVLAIAARSICHGVAKSHCRSIEIASGSAKLRPSVANTYSLIHTNARCAPSSA
ncbi:hypothetical protein AURDEDRAFT_170990 [Auricularia subglabra TFB-10046 SS5]|nr:hypothetical protein AURDEDRAFT_170990 [Auricularia subglabra TFB-10046 SS5]